ncbi:MAG TPA: DUF6491 family protein [Gammaproteobacteria bacterium]|nr:DUF6491 family protein [Gammaproteobacteria bacterium]
MPNRLVLAMALGSAALVLGAHTGHAQNAQNDAGNPSTKRCLPLAQIDRTEVVNDSTILFYMHSDKIYLNALPQRCPNLKFDNRFMYRVHIAQLCDSDVITVLQQIGPGLMPGASCGLGKFQPITQEEAARLEKTTAEESGKKPKKRKQK